MKMSDDISELAKALSKLQGAMKPAKFDASNPFFKSKYTTLAGVWETARELLAENGLAVVQDTFTTDVGVGVSTTIIHSSGQYMTFGDLVIPLGKRDAHAIGSASTYAKRYSLSACLGVCSAEEDDDGNHAVKAGTPPTPAKPKMKPFTPDETEQWFEKWSAEYDIQLLEQYCEARSKHLGHSINQTCAELSSDEDLFVKNINIWFAQQKNK